MQIKRVDGKGMDGSMDERCFRPLLCTVKAELGRGQPGHNDDEFGMKHWADAV